jgi:glycosyltransferase involved in cell wall biosynthesis
MRLVMLSWRYLGHPQGGGAEVLTHEILRRCVDRGWDVTAFTATYPGAAPTEVIDGVKVIRRGVQHTVHAQAWRWLRSRREEFDVVVDQVNTIPFLTPLYVPARQRRLFICQFAREYWFRETRGAFKLVAPFGYALEPWYTRLYRGTRTITISESTRDELEHLGVRVASIIPMAIHTEALPSLAPKPSGLRVVIVGRLTPAKFVEQAITAFAEVQRAEPAARLDVIGSGDPEYRAELDALVLDRGVQHVTFHGRIAEADKMALLADAHFHVFTSHREGWGLTVTEAAAVGTPTVAYDVPGVRDSVADARLLVAKGDTAALAARLLAVHRDPDVYADVRTRAWDGARELSWQRTADAFMAAVA